MKTTVKHFEQNFICVGYDEEFDGVILKMYPEYILQATYDFIEMSIVGEIEYYDIFKKMYGL